MFNAANFSGSSNTDLTNARNIYAVLTGRITQIAANANLDESGKYVYNGISTQRYQQRETGVFAQDSWRARKDLTISMGVRWEVQFPFVALNNRFAVTSYDGLFGVSGTGACSSPGHSRGSRRSSCNCRSGSTRLRPSGRTSRPASESRGTPTWIRASCASSWGRADGA